MAEVDNQMKSSDASSPATGVANGGTDGFVTVVQVSNNNEKIIAKADADTDQIAGAFVTVVELESNSLSKQAEENVPENGSGEMLSCRQDVVMYRLPCERLGMGLKFDGGMQATECVRHVYIQSIAPDSPAQRTQTAWNGLVEGDEILKIDGRPVHEMTRVETVNILKKAPVAIKLYVQHVYRPSKPALKVNQPGLKPGHYLEMSCSVASVSTPKVLPELPSSPPPVPPRKLRPKKSVSPSSSPPTPPPRQIDLLLEHNLRNNLIKQSTVFLPKPIEETEEISEEIKLNEEDESVERRNEYESDDTGSTTSTVVERMTNSVTNNVYFMIGDRRPMDIDQAVAPFEQLEKEFESDSVVTSNNKAHKSAESRPIDPPEKFKDMHQYEIMDSVSQEPLESHPTVYPLSKPAFENQEEVSPPPIPPRKSKLVKSNSCEVQQTNHFTSPSDEWVEDDVTLSIVGNLLQELEQLPEFSRPNTRSNLKNNSTDEVSWSKNSQQINLKSDCAKVCDVSNSETVSTDTYQVNSSVTGAASDDPSSTANWPIDKEATSEVNLLEPSEETVSIPAPDIFDDSSSSSGKAVEESGELAKHAKTVATSLILAYPQEEPAADQNGQQIANIYTDQSCASVMANEVIYSPCSIRDFSESDTFLPVFSRLPPDGHEFPSNYMESDDGLYRFCSVDKSTEGFSPLASQLEKNLLEPPAGFEDSSLARLATVKAESSLLTGDREVISHISGNMNYDDDDDDELPPPPPMSPPTPHQQLLYEIINEPLEFEEFDDDDIEAEMDVSLRKNSLSDSDKSSPPPIPPKRLSSTTSSSSTSTDKTVIAVPLAKSASPSKDAKPGNENMSVRDKIALFTAKVDKVAVQTEKSVKVHKFGPTAVGVKEFSTENSFPSKVEDDYDEDISEDEDEEDEEEDPITAIETTNIDKCPESLLPNYSSIESEPNLFFDRPSSSLSASSNFSKSSDDILAQDVDSSDMDDHLHLHQVQPGSSLSLDRRNFYSPKYYNGNRYSLDLSNGHALDNGNVIKSQTNGVSTVITNKSNTLDNGSRTQSMYSILESRKNTVSKLKGLVIPQIQNGTQPPVASPVPDLPLIYSADSIIKPLNVNKIGMESKSDSEEIKFDFKHHSKSKFDVETVTSSEPAKWLEALPPPPLPKSLPPVLATSLPLPVITPPEIECDDRLDTEDQESGISSIDSPNVSIHNTPPASPKEKPHRRHNYHHLYLNKHHEEDSVVEDVSVVVKKRINNDLYHHSWDSTDDSETSVSSDMKILKTNSVETINKMNVLQCARKNSGNLNNDDGDAKVKLYSDPPRYVTSLVHKPSQRRTSEESLSSNEVMMNNEKDSDKTFISEVDGQTRQNVVQTKLNSPVSDERWLELERKYGGKANESTNVVKKVDKVPNSRVSTLPNYIRKNEENGSIKGFKALAETWKQRTSSVEHETLKSTQKLNKANQNGNCANIAASRQIFEMATVTENGNKNFVEAKPLVRSEKHCPTLITSVSVVSQPPPPSSVVTSQVVHREKPSRASTGSLSRPTSLIETDYKNLKMWSGAPFEENGKKSPSNKLTAMAVDSKITRRGPSDGFHSLNSYNKPSRSTSVNDLRQMFELPNSASVPQKKLVQNNRRIVKDTSTHIRMSSLDSTASESEPGTPGHYGSATSLGSSPAIDHYGSITSLASSTSLISPQELQQLIEEANQSLEESGTPSHEIQVVVLQKEIASGSIGITLAGGADYDSKEITVNKVITGSLADRDGRILKGDRVLSINGKNLKGLTHREALCILKAPRSDCVLVLSRNKSSGPPDVVKDVVGNGLLSRTSNKSLPPRNSYMSKLNPPSAVVYTKPEIAYCPPENLSVPASNGSLTVITTQIIKDSSGLGFSLDGGKDSPLGDRPLTIKKIFNGGAADKNKDVGVGDEILSINGLDVTNMARIEAWNIMKKLPNGVVTLVVNHKR